MVFQEDYRKGACSLVAFNCIESYASCRDKISAAVGVLTKLPYLVWQFKKEIKDKIKKEENKNGKCKKIHSICSRKYATPQCSYN
jgi:Sec-independent protein secretion pathway component TatC